MARGLPYFRWYPADAETDEAYAAMTDVELGFFHRALNKSWVNNGLPADMDELARLMRVKRPYLDKIWQRVGRCFCVSVEDSTRLVNRRQEEERAHAVATSENNKRPGNANATRPKREREPNGPQHAHARAGSDSVSDFQSLEAESFVSRFHEWIAGYRGRKADEDSACRAWISVDGDSAGDAPFACRDRYNASREVAEGKCMEAANFIFQQARNGWRGDWPKAREVKTKSSLAERTVALMQKRIDQGRPPL